MKRVLRGIAASAAAGISVGSLFVAGYAAVALFATYGDGWASRVLWGSWCVGASLTTCGALVIVHGLAPDAAGYKR